jgi:hypothetical protein
MEVYAMADLIVRRLEEDVKERFKARAKKHGRSVEAEARAVIEHAAREPLDSTTAPLVDDGFGTMMKRTFGLRGLTPSEGNRLQRASLELRDPSMWGIPDFEG